MVESAVEKVVASVGDLPQRRMGMGDGDDDDDDIFFGSCLLRASLDVFCVLGVGVWSGCIWQVGGGFLEG